MLNVTLESFSNMMFKIAVENVIVDPNNYLNWLNLANHFGGSSSTNSKVPFICNRNCTGGSPTSSDLGLSL